MAKVYYFIIAIAFLAVLGLVAIDSAEARNTTCPSASGGISCPSGVLCGGICLSQDELPSAPTNPDPLNYSLDCSSCAWVCDVGKVSCDGLCQDPATSCKLGSPNCQDSGQCEAGYNLDQCGNCTEVAVTYEPVYLNYPTAQDGIVKLNGQLGVGTASPIEKLQVIGNVRIGAVTDNNSQVAGYGDRLYFSGGGDWSSWNSDNSDPLWLARYNAGNNRSELRVNIADDNHSGDAFMVGNTFYSDKKYYPFFRVQTDGKVGIGTANPNSGSNSVLLHIKSYNNRNAELDIQAGDNPHWAIYQNTADQNLNIWHQGNNVAVFKTDGSVAFSELCLNGDCRTEWPIFEDIVYDGLWLESNGSIYRQSGNVGIGSINPQDKLEVAGIISTTEGGIKFPDGTIQTTAAVSGSGETSLWSELNGNVYRDSGRVGIGTNNPSSILNLVVGNDTEGLKIVSSNYSPIVVRDSSDQNDMFRLDQFGNITIGPNNQILGNSFYSLAWGVGSKVNSGVFALAFGSGSEASGNNSIAMGNSAKAIGTQSLAIGSSALASGQMSISLGSGDALGHSAIVLGTADNTMASGQGAIAIGENVSALGGGAMAMGFNMRVEGVYSVGIGMSEVAEQQVISRDNVMSIMGGDVGISTTNPASKLEVSGDSNSAGVIRITDINPIYGYNPELQLQYGANDSEHWGIYVAKGDSNKLKFWNNDNGNVLSFDQSGKVQIRNEDSLNYQGSEYSYDGSLYLGVNAKLGEDFYTYLDTMGDVKFGSNSNSLPIPLILNKSGGPIGISTTNPSMGVNLEIGASENKEGLVINASNYSPFVVRDSGFDLFRINQDGIVSVDGQIVIINSSLEDPALRIYSLTNESPLINFGNNSTISGGSSVIIGEGSQLSGKESYILGTGGIIQGDNSLAFGAQSKIMGNNSVAFGGSEVNGNNSYGFGTQWGAKVSGTGSIGFGPANINGDSSVGFGGQGGVKIVGNGSYAFGGGEIDGGNSYVFGGYNGSVINGNNSYAFGDDNTINGNDSVAFGRQVVINADNSFVVGDQVTVSKSNSFVVTNNVGVRNPDPKVALDVNGLIRTSSTGGAMQCTTEIEGALYYDNTEKKFKGCSCEDFCSWRNLVLESVQ